MLSLVCISIVVFLIAYFYDNNLIHDSQRFRFYQHTFDFYVNYIDKWFGVGTGLFNVFGKIIQAKYNYHVDSEIMVFVHNDYLEVLFVNGIVGLSLLLWSITVAIYKTIDRRDYALLSAMAGYLGAMLFDYPLRYPIHSIIGAYLLAHGMRDRKRIYNRKLEL